MTASTIHDAKPRAASALVAFSLLVGACALPPRPPSPDATLTTFEQQVDALRAELGIPGLSAAIVRDQQVVWARGFGYADHENRVPATPDTVYHVASVTKTFAATLAMQLVEQGKLDLDEPASHYSSDFKDDAVRVKHLLSHTSEGPTPGERYAYSGERYDYLTAVVEKGTGKSFRAATVDTILDPLGMSSSVPGHDVADDAMVGKRYAAILATLSQPYTLYGDGEIVHVPYPPKGFSAAAGLLSTVMDLARYDAALDRHVLLKKETQDKAWTPFVSTGGQRLPYGLGWFVKDDHGVRLIWHGGNWGKGFSALYLKVPEKRLSLIMLANSEALNDHKYAIGEEIVNDAFACAFLRLVVFEGARSLDCERSSRTAVANWKEARRSQARPVVPIDPAILDAYVGRYRFEFDPTMILDVTRAGGKLYVDVPANRQTEVFPASPSTFFLKIRRADITFVHERGKATHLQWAEHGESLRANRIE